MFSSMCEHMLVEVVFRIQTEFSVIVILHVAYRQLGDMIVPIVGDDV